MNNLVWGFPNSAFKVSGVPFIATGRVVFGDGTGGLGTSANLIYDTVNVRLGIGVTPSNTISIQKNAQVDVVTYNRNNGVNLVYGNEIYRHDINGFRNGGAGNQTIARVQAFYLGDGTSRNGFIGIGTAEITGFGNPQFKLFSVGNVKYSCIGSSAAGQVDPSLTPSFSTQYSPAANLILMSGGNPGFAAVAFGHSGFYHSIIHNNTNWTIGATNDEGFKLDVGGTGRFRTSLLVAPAGSTTNASAAFQVDSTTKGVLIPRMTTAQRTAIVLPAAGLIVYDTDTNKSYTYDGTSWQQHY